MSSQTPERGSDRRPGLLRRVLVVTIVISLTVPLAAGAGGGGTPGLLAGDATAGPTTAVDVVFVFDRTSSIDDDRDALAGEMNAIDERLDEAGIDARYALLTYTGSARLEQGWTTDYGDIDDALDFQAVGQVENASVALSTAASMDFREGAGRVVVLVTDEDDDGTAEQRRDAVDALSAVHLVAVSPDDPAVSSCEERLEPCDSNASNELRTIADDVGGDWINVAEDAPDIVAEASPIIEAEAAELPSQEEEDDDDPELAVANATFNRTTVEVGEPVEITVAIENTGEESGRFDAHLADEHAILDSQTVEVPADDVRTVRFVTAFSEPASYEMFVTHDYVGQIEVTPLRPTTVDTSVRDGGSTLVANVSDARAAAPVTVPLRGLEVAAGGNGSLENLTVTPTRDVDFQLRVEARDEPPEGTGPLASGVHPMAFLVADTTLESGDIDSASLRLSSMPDAAAVYHYTGAGATWVPLESSASGENATMVVRTGGFSTFAVGLREPTLTVLDVTVDDENPVVGEPVTATVLVENEGAADGTVRAAVTADGEPVAEATAPVPAGQLEWVTVTFTPDAAGTYRLSAAGGAGHAIDVEAPSTPAPSTGTRAAPTESGPTETPGQPGFGAGVVVAVLVALALLARVRE